MPANLIPLQTGIGPGGPFARLRLLAPAPSGGWPDAPPGCRMEVVADGVEVLGPAEGLLGLASELGSVPGGPELRRAGEALLHPPPPLRLGRWSWRFGTRTYVLGVVNVTPDSFSGDGVGGSPAAALERARRLVAAGADAIDVGGESSRPGHQPVPEAEELRRVVPACEALVAELEVPVFVDTAKVAVAQAGLGIGASGINDIWGLRRDPAMARAVKESGAAVICMHNQVGVEYRDLLEGVAIGLQESLRAAATAGIPRSQVVLDPGIGFGKTPGQSAQVLRRLGLLRLLGSPLLVGTSRKSVVGWLLGNRPVEGRRWGTAATVAFAIQAGADIVRVHDVAEMRDVADVTDRLARDR